VFALKVPDVNATVNTLLSMEAVPAAPADDVNVAEVPAAQLGEPESVTISSALDGSAAAGNLHEALGTGGGERREDDATAQLHNIRCVNKVAHCAAQAQHQLQRALLLHVVVGEGAVMLQLLAPEDAAVLSQLPTR